MCGRFTLVKNHDMGLLAEALGVPDCLETQYNNAPTDPIQIITGSDEQRACHVAKWWFTPSWSKTPDSTKYPMFNARSETLEEKKSFKDSFRYKRCLIPATSFIEWKTQGANKIPYEVTLESAPMIFAGIYDIWRDDLFSTAIITTESRSDFAGIHKRMPVMLSIENAKLWLNAKTRVDLLTPIFKEAAPSSIAITPVDNSIGDSKKKVATIATGDKIILGIENYKNSR